jgi:hypothetical protein
MEAEGWYADPFGVHEARWFSDGRPTALVRDADTEGHDDPPSGTLSGSLTPIDDGGSPGPEGMRRADEADGTYDPDKGVRAVWDAYVQLPKK